jgi:hypothetical protein
MLMSAIIARVREANGDNGTTAIRTDANYLTMLQEAIDRVCDDIPGARMSATGTITAQPSSTATTTSSDFPIAVQFAQHVVEFACWRYFGSDSGDTRDERRASVHWSNYRNLVAPSGD